jgi:hypothetical protein
MLSGQMVSEFPCKKCDQLTMFANTGGGYCEICKPNKPDGYRSYLSGDHANVDAIIAEESSQTKQRNAGELTALQAENTRLREALKTINRMSSAGNRTFEDFMRDMSYINSHAREALNSSGSMKE